MLQHILISKCFNRTTKKPPSNPELENNQTIPIKVAIVCNERTGSSYLHSTLGKHKNTVAYGEVFNPTTKGNIKLMERYNKKPIVRNEDGAQFLLNLFQDYPNDIQAIICKIIYGQAQRNRRWAKAWDYLRYNNVKIIHLYRENLLDQYLSLQLAKRTQYWGSDRPGYTQEKYNTPIIIKPRKCIRFMRKNKQYIHYVNNYFANSPKLNISYEKLLAQPDACLKQIQEFIGLPYQDNLIPKLTKQRNKPKSKIIKNYDDLAKKLVHTEWEACLTLTE